ncbi:MAG: hypothetical protein WC784_00960 [Candidatus Shapirobacteria bacterium]|jgi:hypothetical protein
MLPKSVKSVLWSYDTGKIDLNKDKKTLISQILNYGSKEATDWAILNYGKKEMRKTALSIPLGRWNKKSLALWSLVFNFKTDSIKNRFK